MAGVWSVGCEEGEPDVARHRRDLDRFLEHTYDSDHDDNALFSCKQRFVAQPSTAAQIRAWIDSPPDPEVVTTPGGFYVESAPVVAERTIRTLYDDVTSDEEARDLTGSLRAMHVRGGAGDAATKNPCPNHKLGGVALATSAAIRGAAFFSEDVITGAEPIHKALMEHVNSRACFSFSRERVRSFIAAVAGPEHVETASAIFETMQNSWSEVDIELFQWLLKREPRPQVAKMLMSQFASSLEMIALLCRFASLWSAALIRKKASGAELDDGRDAKSHWRGEVEIVCRRDYDDLVSSAKDHVSGWGQQDVQRELAKAHRFELTQARIAEIGKPEIYRSHSSSLLPMTAVAALIRDDVPLRVRQDNPKRGASKARFERYMDAEWAREFVALGGTKEDLQYDLLNGHVFLLSSEGPDAHDVDWWKDPRVIAATRGRRRVDAPPATGRAAPAPSRGRTGFSGLPAAKGWPHEFAATLRAHKVPCKFVAPNPKRARGHADWSRYDQYMTATTVDVFFARHGRWKDLKYDVRRGFCTLDAAALDTAWRDFSAPAPRSAERS